ncbi:hypothetical protein, partial [Alistipes sp.]|uniref:hypothetical protein n=1 Tax=Alistipes sp. TaxID=1872444 RepID=UPI003AF14753
MNTGILLAIVLLAVLVAVLGTVTAALRRETVRLAAEKRAAEAARDEALAELRRLGEQRTAVEAELAA